MDQVERLLQKPACLIDLFPRQVPREGCSRFSKVEYHYLSQFAAYGLDRRYAGVLLKVSAQYPTVLGWEGWTENPAPDQLVGAVHTVMENHSGWVHLLLPEEDALLFFEWDCLQMVVYNPGEELGRFLEEIARSEGFFWRAAEEGAPS